MKKLHLTLLAASCTAVLTACSGGSGISANIAPYGSVVIKTDEQKKADYATTDADKYKAEVAKATAAVAAAMTNPATKVTEDNGGTPKLIDSKTQDDVEAAIKNINDAAKDIATALQTANDSVERAEKALQDAKDKNASADVIKYIENVIDNAKKTIAEAQAAQAKNEADKKTLTDLRDEKWAPVYEPKAPTTATQTPSADNFKTALGNAVKPASNGWNKAYVLPYWFANGDSTYNGVLSINNSTGDVTGSTNPNNTDNNWRKRQFDEISLNGQLIKLENLTTDLKAASSLVDHEGNSIKDKFSGGYVAGFSNLSYGVYNDIDGTNSYLFVQGKVTDQDYMPVSGTYNYTGNAVLGKNGSYETLNGKVAAEVNFVSRTVNVNITAPKEVLSFNGNIYYDASKSGTKIGNSFSGNGGHGDMAGGFFGEKDPTQIGGFFNVTKSGSAYEGYNGVFGAEKQP